MSGTDLRRARHIVPDTRICDECAGMTTTNDGSYRCLIRSTAFTLHFCSAACASANLNTPGLPDRFRKLTIYAVVTTVIDLAICAYLIIR